MDIMIRSMTGFGRANYCDAQKSVTVEIKSLNNRYFEFSARTPKDCSFLEKNIKTYINKRIKRGKVNVMVTIESFDDSPVKIRVNHSLARGYISALEELGREHKISGDISVFNLSSYPDVLVISKNQEDENELWRKVKPVLDEATCKLIDMREKEGKEIAEDILMRLGFILKQIELIDRNSPRRVKEYRERLKQKLEDMLENHKVDEQRLLTEAALFADKTAVDEETIRLKSHLKQMNDLCLESEPVGRRLDFLVQEMNREINTIGSKSSDTETAYIVVEVKSELEKIREQVQNIE